jgi:hypothetical protein
MYNNVNNKYNDVLLNTGSVEKIQWENSLVVTNDLKVIKNSNHYICSGYYWGEHYDLVYKIYRNILRNYNQILVSNNINYDFFDENKEYFYFINAFCFSNSGHDLSTMLDFVHYIIENKVTHILHRPKRKMRQT